jgi:hypothetical protein
VVDWGSYGYVHAIDGTCTLREPPHILIAGDNFSQSIASWEFKKRVLQFITYRLASVMNNVTNGGTSNAKMLLQSPVFDIRCEFPQGDG